MSSKAISGPAKLQFVVSQEILVVRRYWRAYFFHGWYFFLIGESGDVVIFVRFDPRERLVEARVLGSPGPVLYFYLNRSRWRMPWENRKPCSSA